MFTLIDTAGGLFLEEKEIYFLGWHIRVKIKPERCNSDLTQRRKDAKTQGLETNLAP
jgi:hypothetical protein